jgi:hypothetical protein
MNDNPFQCFEPFSVYCYFYAGRVLCYDHVLFSCVFRIILKLRFRNYMPLFFLWSYFFRNILELHFHECYTPVLFRVFISSKTFLSFASVNAMPLFFLGSSFLSKHS